MKVLLIRHGQTIGNLHKKYIGRTDEPLCSEGIKALKCTEIPECDVVIASPMKRCIQTARILFPGAEPTLCSDLRECDFGDFEGKNYLELSGNSDYQRWIDSGGTLPFPGGESPENFRLRCIRAFSEIVDQHKQARCIALVVHGGTIMSIMSRYGVPKKDYFSWNVPNGHGFLCQFKQNSLIVMEQI